MCAACMARRSSFSSNGNLHGQFHAIPGRAHHVVRLRHWIEGEAIRQLEHAATLPACGASPACPIFTPDAATRWRRVLLDGRLYPALIGGDIGCGMALWQTALDARRVSASKLASRLGSIDATPDASWQPLLRPPGSRITRTRHRSARSAAAIISRKRSGSTRCTTPMPSRRSASTPIACCCSCIADRAASASRSSSNTCASTATTASTTRMPCTAYLARHDAALRYAIANRDLIARRMLARWRTDGRCVLDVNHNLVSRTRVDGEPGWLHRKGATPADAGPVVIPGSRGDYSYLVAPVRPTMRPAWRRWRTVRAASGAATARAPRTALHAVAAHAHAARQPRDLRRPRTAVRGSAAEPIDSVVDALEAAGLLRKLARLAPVLTYKTSGEAGRC